MIIGNYPCCDGIMTLALPDVDFPVLAREVCPHCGETVWHLLSRIDPKSWTEEAFNEAFKWNAEENAYQLIVTPAQEKP